MPKCTTLRNELACDKQGSTEVIKSHLEAENSICNANLPNQHNILPQLRRSRPITAHPPRGFSRRLKNNRPSLCFSCLYECWGAFVPKNIGIVCLVFCLLLIVIPRSYFPLCFSFPFIFFLLCIIYHKMTISIMGFPKTVGLVGNAAI